MVTMIDSLRGSQVPAIRSVPDYVSSRGGEAIELAESVGLHLDGWQKMVLTDALGVRADGGWSAPEAGLVVPRQNGKSVVLVARHLAGLFLFGERLLFHSAHEFTTSLETFLLLLALLEGSEELSGQVRRVSRTHGDEGIELLDGARLRFRTRTRGGGRGFSADFVAYDEGQLLPEASQAALLPTLSARPNSQTWYAGTPPDQMNNEHGVVLARARERALRGDDRLCWSEWTIAEAKDPAAVDATLASDPEAWARSNPALGYRITLEHVERELRAMDHRSFCSERLGVGDWPRTDLDGGRVISADAWKACAGDAAAGEPLVFGFDISPDRSRASIAVAGAASDGRVAVEIVDHRDGTGWIVGRLQELCQRHYPRAVVCDGRGPASSLVAALSRLRPAVTTLTTSEFASSCAGLFDRIQERTLVHREDPALDAAVAVATKRGLGDQWAWSRRSSAADITALVAASVAVSVWEQHARQRAYLDDGGAYEALTAAEKLEVDAIVEEALEERMGTEQ